jgi:uncharacterized membrane protein
MVRGLVIASLVWPIALGSLGIARSLDPASSWAAVGYAALSRICHQRPERSFHTGGVQWPVCARCAGLYLAAPIGAIAAWWRRRGRPRPGLVWLAAAAAPTVMSVAAEVTGLWPGAPVLRAAAALPLGAAVAAVLVREADRPRSVD